MEKKRKINIDLPFSYDTLLPNICLPKTLNIYPPKDFLTPSIHGDHYLTLAFNPCHRTLEQSHWDQVMDTKMSTLVKPLFKGTSNSLRDIPPWGRAWISLSLYLLCFPRVIPRFCRGTCGKL